MTGRCHVLQALLVAIQPELMMAIRHIFGFDPSSRGVAERLKRGGKQRLYRGGGSAADHVEQVASLLKIAGGELLRNPVLAAGIARFGARLRDGSAVQLAHDVRRAAQRYPALFVVGGLALGVVCARLARAVATQDVVEVERVVPKEHFTTVSSSERRQRTFGD